jgi:hypothetical protein
MEIVYATNPKASHESIDGNLSQAESYAACDSMHSPLVVKLKGGALHLSSPSEGILFDIQGENNHHVKNQISWPVDDSIAFISLPNAFGRVNGIDELFGDNTMGPDGKFAVNGYRALAKYDDNRDGLIDQRDKVFSKLRLFIDANRNGVSDQGELRALREYEIQSIDLAYDANYAEKDIYGNQILYKSAAETSHGFLQVFDIWFRAIR